MKYVNNEIEMSSSKTNVNKIDESEDNEYDHIDVEPLSDKELLEFKQQERFIKDYNSKMFFKMAVDFNNIANKYIEGCIKVGSDYKDLLYNDFKDIQKSNNLSLISIWNLKDIKLIHNNCLNNNNHDKLLNNIDKGMLKIEIPMNNQEITHINFINGNDIILDNYGRYLFVISIFPETKLKYNYLKVKKEKIENFNSSDFNSNNDDGIKESDKDPKTVISSKFIFLSNVNYTIKYSIFRGYTKARVINSFYKSGILGFTTENNSTHFYYLPKFDEDWIENFLFSKIEKTYKEAIHLDVLKRNKGILHSNIYIINDLDDDINNLYVEIIQSTDLYVLRSQYQYLLLQNSQSFNSEKNSNNSNIFELLLEEKILDKSNLDFILTHKSKDLMYTSMGSNSFNPSSKKHKELNSDSIDRSKISFTFSEDKESNDLKCVKNNCQFNDYVNKDILECIQKINKRDNNIKDMCILNRINCNPFITPFKKDKSIENETFSKNIADIISLTNSILSINYLHNYKNFDNLVISFEVCFEIISDKDCRDKVYENTNLQKNKINSYISSFSLFTKNMTKVESLQAVYDNSEYSGMEKYSSTYKLQRKRIKTDPEISDKSIIPKLVVNVNAIKSNDDKDKIDYDKEKNYYESKIDRLDNEKDYELSNESGCKIDDSMYKNTMSSVTNNNITLLKNISSKLSNTCIDDCKKLNKKEILKENINNAMQSKLFQQSYKNDQITINQSGGLEINYDYQFKKD